VFYRNTAETNHKRLALVLQTCAVVKVTGYMIMKFTQYVKNTAPNGDWSSLFLNRTS